MTRDFAPCIVTPPRVTSWDPTVCSLPPQAVTSSPIVTSDVTTTPSRIRRPCGRLMFSSDLSAFTAISTPAEAAFTRRSRRFYARLSSQSPRMRTRGRPGYPASRSINLGRLRWVARRRERRPRPPERPLVVGISDALADGPPSARGGSATPFVDRHTGGGRGTMMTLVDGTDGVAGGGGWVHGVWLGGFAGRTGRVVAGKLNRRMMRPSGPYQVELSGVLAGDGRWTARLSSTLIDRLR